MRQAGAVAVLLAVATGAPAADPQQLRLGSDEWPPFTGSPDKQRAIYTLYRMGRDNAGKRAKVVEMLIKNLDNPSKAAMEASIFALDRLTPKGDPKLVARIQEVYSIIKSSYKGRARMLESFIGRVRNRAK